MGFVRLPLRLSSGTLTLQDKGMKSLTEQTGAGFPWKQKPFHSDMTNDAPFAFEM